MINMKMNKPELLAPAGDMESLEAALSFGADAVYLGGRLLQLRASRAAFDDEKLIKAVKLAHSKNKKIFVTVNSFAFNDEIALCAEYARFLRDAGVDAAIICDLGVMSEFRKAAPELEIHVSTQANTMNYSAANVLCSLGAKRIVLARELSLDEIRKLRDNLPDDVELEAFVHGAMCMSYSGRCILSSFLTNRSGNRGECSQPCRWNYALVEEKRPGEFFPIYENGEFTTILSSHDLCCIDFLDKLHDAGVTSFKIEGRMKTAYYVATAVNAYRKAIDGADSIENCRAELYALKHRPYSSGFYFGDVVHSHSNDGHYSQDCTFIGNVIGWENGILKLRQRNRFSVGETLEVLSPNLPVIKFEVTEIVNEDGERQDSAPHPNQIVFVPCETELKPGDFLRRRDRV